MANNEQELGLACQMKDNYCDASGKEIDPAKAAEILYQIGLIYKQRSSDKIALIQSAGLLNAAIFRQPSNVKQIKSDLVELCQHILEMSNAKNQNVDLIQKAEQVKTKIAELRFEVKILLDYLPKLPNNTTKMDSNKIKKGKIIIMKLINKMIADKYKQIMAELSKFCEFVMGKPPCEYAIVGMGSLAREEITPYSDFEHIILLVDDPNYKLHLEYFRWFSVIFHIIVLNVQETIVPSLNIYSLNDKNSSLGDWYYDDVTKRGISFDGMMPHACKFPLGRQQPTEKKQFTTELIKPVNEMLNYLTSEADLKQGYHLADILTKTCFVYGNVDIFDQFEHSVKKYQRSKSPLDHLSEVKQQVKVDLDKFSTRFRLRNLKSQRNINIKQLVYRSSTVFISALARKYNISANSCFDIIHKMAKNFRITANTADKLRLAIATACEMRLRVYTNMKSQCDNSIKITQQGIETFLNVVGVASTINYFQIVYCLQCEVAKQLNFTKFYFYSNAQFINITIGLAFRVGALTNFPTNLTQSCSWKSSEFDFDTCIEKLETGTTLDAGVEAPKSSTFASNQSHPTNLVKSFAKKLLSAQIYDEALEFYKQLLDIYESNVTDNSRNCDVSFSNDEIGGCFLSLNQKENALQYHRKALEIFRNANASVRSIPTVHNNIGFCNILLANYDEALRNLNHSVEIRQNAALNADVDDDIAESLKCIGDCNIKLRNHHEALKCLNKALKAFQSLTPTADSQRKVAYTCKSIGQCYLEIKNYDMALIKLNQALGIFENTTLNVDTDANIAATQHDIGRCYYYLNNSYEASKSFSKALTIFQNLTLNADKDQNIAASYSFIGLCYSNMYNYNEAVRNLSKALEIYKKIAICVDTDEDVSIAFHNIGSCHIDLHNYDEALTNLNRSLEIKQNATTDADTDRSLATTLHEIGGCHIDLRNYDEALANLIRSLEIKQNSTSNAEKDKNLAVTLVVIAYCYIDLCNYNEALTHLKQAFKIFRLTSSDVNKDRNLAITQCNIGRCRTGLQQYDEAWYCFKKSLKVFQNTTLDENKDIRIANNYNYMGGCLIAKQQFADALLNLRKAREIYQTQINAGRDTRLGMTQYSIGICCMNLKCYSDASNHLKEALKIYKRLPHNKYITSKIELIRSKLDECVVKRLIG